MLSWNQLFVRHGWLLTKKEENVFDCKNETDMNVDFLMECLKKAEIPFTYEKEVLTLPTPYYSEKKWIEVIDFEFRGRGEGLWFRPGIEDPKVRELDTYISGVVRQFNRLGFYTKGSCDGHERRTPHVLVTKEIEINKLSELFLALGFKRLYYRERPNSYHISFPQSREELLDLAEKLSMIDLDWIEQGYEYIKEQLFLLSLEELLTIPGASGDEADIRDLVKQKLTHHVDHITVDHAGNLLAEKTYRGGNGPTILLNVHLDTVDVIAPNRKIVKEENIWSSSHGILGADDRAGVAVLLHLAECLNLTSSFSGKVKFIFTVEEESGLVGARHVNNYFLWGTDAAIVIDRRGTGDIVTSCGGYIPFCDSQYGAFFEEVAKGEGLNGWAARSGGSSDTRIWAEHGIQSVNLSAGYYNEHTDQESLDVNACYEVTKLLKAVFNKRRELRTVLQAIRRKRVVDRVMYHVQSHGKGMSLWRG